MFGLSWCLTYGVIVIYYIILYYYYIIYYILYYIIYYYYYILYILYLILYSSSLLIYFPPILFSFPSSSYLPFLFYSSSSSQSFSSPSSSHHPIQSIRVGSSLCLFMFNPDLFLSSFILYLSVLTYTYLYSSRFPKYLTPHVLSEWMVEV